MSGPASSLVIFARGAVAKAVVVVVAVVVVIVVVDAANIVTIDKIIHTAAVAATSHTGTLLLRLWLWLLL